MKYGRRAFLTRTGTAVLAGGLVSRLPGRDIPEESADAVRTEGYSSADPWIEVDRAAIDFNVRQLKKKAGGRPILAVLKCNAYGHGLVGVAKGLERSPVHSLVVGRLSEALALRAAGISLPILNLGPFSRADAESIVRIANTLRDWENKVGPTRERGPVYAGERSFHRPTNTSGRGRNSQV